EGGSPPPGQRRDTAGSASQLRHRRRTLPAPRPQANSVSLCGLLESLAGRDLPRGLGGTSLGRWLGSRVIERPERQPRPSSAPEPPGFATGGRTMTLKGRGLQTVTVRGALALV